MKMVVSSCNCRDGHSCWVHKDSEAETERRLSKAFDDVREVHIARDDYGARTLLELVNSHGESQVLRVWAKFATPDDVIMRLAFPELFPEMVQVASSKS